MKTHMTDAQLDKLSKLVTMVETVAKLGGTPQFRRIQPIVADALQDLLDEVEEQSREGNEPKEPATTATVDVNPGRRL